MQKLSGHGLKCHANKFSVSKQQNDVIMLHKTVNQKITQYLPIGSPIFIDSLLNSVISAFGANFV